MPGTSRYNKNGKGKDEVYADRIPISLFRRIAQDIQIETDKKLTIAEIHQGMKYDKKVLISEKKQRIGKAQVAVYDKPGHVQLRVEMFDGTQVIDVQCAALGKNRCQVTYNEEFLPSNMEKKLAIASFSWMGRKNNKKKLKRLMEQWETEIRQLYGE